MPYRLIARFRRGLPLGRDAAGLAFGLQIVGRKYDDVRVIAFGKDVEALLSGRGA